MIAKLSSTSDPHWSLYCCPNLHLATTYLRRLPCILPRRKRFRRRGKRGGALVHQKAYLTASSGTYPRIRCHGLPAARHLRDRWIHPVFPELRPLLGPLTAPPARLTSPGPRGVQHAHLRPLIRTTPSASPERKLCMALLNARSIVNKTFLLNDFFTSRELDLMFLTETWVHAGEYTPFSELLPPDCTFFSSPSATGRGGGLASVFRASLQCRLLYLVTSYASFELQLFELNPASPVLCTVVYRPPKCNKDFINYFSDFLSGIMVKYDRVLICGDSNVHVCCESKPLVRLRHGAHGDSGHSSQWVLFHHTWRVMAQKHPRSVSAQGSYKIRMNPIFDATQP